MPTVHPMRSRLAVPRPVLVALATFALGAGQAFAQSCAMCLASFGQNDPTARAFSWSILFLMAAPYSIVATAAGWLFLAYRRAPGRQRSSVIDLAPLRQPAPEAPGGDPS